jgi:hypothetical protein
MSALLLGVRFPYAREVLWRDWRKAYGCQFNSIVCEGFGSGLVDIACNAADLELGRELGIAQDMLDDRATLVASGTEDSDQLGHFD